METIKVISVVVSEGFVVALEFSDGVMKEIDLEPYLSGEVFEAIHDDPKLFRQVRVVEGERTISWPNGADIDPYTLYYALRPEWNDEDEALAAALAQRRRGLPSVQSEPVRPKIGIR
jgi:hypothetical protein